MILCICPNPSVDYTVYVDDFKKDELNRSEKKEITYSGKALNVAIGVARLKGDSYATGFMFNSNGQNFEHNLLKENVNNTFIWSCGTVRTNIKIIDKDGSMTEINDRGDNVEVDKQQELLRLTQDLSASADVAVLSGSLPKGVDDDFYFKLASKLSPKCKVIVDTEGDKLIKAISAKIYMIKPNLSELEGIYGKKFTSRDEIIVEARKLIKMGVENVLISMGEKGALLVSETECYYGKSPKVTVKNTVGAGDSMLSAVSLKIKDNATMEEILKAGVCAGACSVMSSRTSLFDKDTYDTLINKIEVEKIL